MRKYYTFAFVTNNRHITFNFLSLKFLSNNLLDITVKDSKLTNEDG